MYYSDEQFAEKVNDKVGNVRFYKKCLRERDRIGSHQQLSDEHIEDFKKIQETKEKLNSTWAQAMNEVLDEFSLAKDDSNVILKEILNTLKRIESKLD